MGEFCGWADKEKQSSNPLSVILPVYNACNSFLPFVHALKIAYESGGELEIVDVRKEWEITEPIGVRVLLEKWGVLHANSSRADVLNAGLRIKKVVRKGNKKKEIIKRLDYHLHDLLVIGSNFHYGIIPFFLRNLAMEIISHCDYPVLFVPEDAKSFVNSESGETTINNIHIITNDLAAFKYALKAVRMLKNLFPSIHPVISGVQPDHLISGSDFDFSGLRYRQITENGQGNPLNSITSHNTDLIIISDKNDNFLQRKLNFFGALHLLRKTSCPVFWIASN